MDSEFLFFLAIFSGVMGLVFWDRDRLPMPGLWQPDSRFQVR